MMKKKVKKYKPRGYWSKENCLKDALKYKTRNEFRVNSKTAYTYAWRNNWLDECFEHMEELQYPIGYWTKNKCKEEALKYKTKTEFKDNSSSAYRKSIKNGWHLEVCSHMKPLGNLKKRLIYVFEFPDKSVYVGLTHDSDERYIGHMSKKSSVNKYFKKTNLKPKYKLLTDYIDIEVAIEKEGKIVDKYKNNGWKILNRAKTGGIGGNIRKWTKDECLIVAKKCKGRREFQTTYAGAYNSAYDNDWLDECCKHMISKYKASNYYTFKKCKQIAKSCKTKIEFKTKCNSAYRKAIKNGWLSKISKHMIELQKPAGFWTKKRCIEEAFKYKTRTAWAKGSSASYSIAHRNGWLKSIYKEVKF